MNTVILEEDLVSSNNSLIVDYYYHLRFQMIATLTMHVVILIQFRMIENSTEDTSVNWTEAINEFIFLHVLN